MADSENQPDPPAPRKTLKLKSPVNRPPPPPPEPKVILPRNQQGATWADEHKSRMQADMDALNAGGKPSGRSDRRR